TAWAEGPGHNGVSITQPCKGGTIEPLHSLASAEPRYYPTLCLALSGLDHLSVTFSWAFSPGYHIAGFQPWEPAYDSRYSNRLLTEASSIVPSSIVAMRTTQQNRAVSPQCDGLSTLIPFFRAAGPQCDRLS